jgi:hypothetical protein
MSLLAFALMVAISVTPEWSQASTTTNSRADSAKQVMIDYWAMETNGGRLTGTGWKKASSFFLHSSPQPAHLEIAVVYDDSAVWNPVIRGDSADVIIGVRKAGKIDSELKYTESRSSATKQGVSFHLVRGNAMGESSESAAERPRSVAPEWKLDRPSAVIWLNLTTAVHYVSDQLNQAKDPLIRGNAARTLRTLSDLQAHQRSE